MQVRTDDEKSKNNSSVLLSKKTEASSKDEDENRIEEAAHRSSDQLQLKGSFSVESDRTVTQFEPNLCDTPRQEDYFHLNENQTKSVSNGIKQRELSETLVQNIY